MGKKGTPATGLGSLKTLVEPSGATTALPPRTSHLPEGPVGLPPFGSEWTATGLSTLLEPETATVNHVKRIYLRRANRYNIRLDKGLIKVYQSTVCIMSPWQIN